MTFVMEGARDILELAGSALYLEQQISALEKAVSESPNLVPDLARTLVETICTTILNDRGIESNSLGFKDLLQQTYNSVPLLPLEKQDSGKTLEAIQQLIDSLDNAIGSLTQLRHNEGLASHGKDAYFIPLETIQAEFIARSVDAIVTFLYMAHRQYVKEPIHRLISYSDYPDLNDFIDDNNDPVVIFDLTYPPSEVLFNIDRQAYLATLNQFLESASDD